MNQQQQQDDCSTPVAKRPNVVTSLRGKWSSKNDSGRRVASGSANIKTWLGTAKTSTPDVKSLGSKVIRERGNLAGVGLCPPCHELPADPKQPRPDMGSAKIEENPVVVANAEITMNCNVTPPDAKLIIPSPVGPSCSKSDPIVNVDTSDDSENGMFIPKEDGLNSVHSPQIRQNSGNFEVKSPNLGHFRRNATFEVENLVNVAAPVVLNEPVGRRIF